jgi:hypothetical protein
MIDYNNGKPNARYWVLKIIEDSFHPGDKLVANNGKDQSDSVMIQGFITPQGKKVLLVNKTNRDQTVVLGSDFANASSLTVDEASGDEAPRAGNSAGSELKMAPFAVTILSAQ